MAIFSILALKNRITERIHANRSRSITGVDLQEILHDIIDSLFGAVGTSEPGASTIGIPFTDYGLSGSINGVNTIFTTSQDFIALSAHVYLNGVRQFRGQDYTEQGNGTISFITAPFTGDKIIVDYSYLTT